MATKTIPVRPPPPPGPAVQRHLVAINEALLLGALRQHELTAVTEKLNLRLQAEITERKLAEILVRLSEIRYRRLFETAHDGVLLLDPRTRQITDANPFMTKLLGYRRAQLIGKELSEIGLLKDKSASRAMFQRLKRTHQIRYENLPLKSNDGRHQEVEVVANLYDEDGQPVIQCNIRDITERKQAEAALRASEERLRFALQWSHTGGWDLDLRDSTMICTMEHDRLFGYESPRRGGWSLKTFARHVLPKDRAGFEGRFRQAIAQRAELNFECRIRRTDGEVRWIFVAGGHQRTGTREDSRLVGIIRDITAQKQADQAQRRLVALAAANLAANREIIRRREIETSLRESETVQRALLGESRSLHAQLRQLTRQFITAQEVERKQISRDLHDDVLQTLVGINVALSTLGKGAAPLPPALKAKIAHTQRLVRNSVNTVHRFARDLRPAVLDDFGLLPALQDYSQALAARKNFQIHLTATEGINALDSSRRTVLFRVAQEALANVARHARASAVKMRISRISGAIRLVVHDNGKSFNPGQTLTPGKNKRLGLLGMRERLEMVGGTLVIESAPGRGTSVCAEIPLHAGGAA